MSISICYAAIYILEACILWQYCRNLFPSKYTKQCEAISLFTGYCILFIGSFFNNYLLNLLLFFIINLLCFIIIYQLKPLTALFPDSTMHVYLYQAEDKKGTFFQQKHPISKHYSLAVSIYRICTCDRMYKSFSFSDSGYFNQHQCYYTSCYQHLSSMVSYLHTGKKSTICGNADTSAKRI